MIFGFNTDVKQGDVVYHVQSEVRQGEGRLETQVFVRGRCIGKRVTSFAFDPEGRERELQDMLKAQHRQVLDAVREGRLESVFSDPELKIEWLSAEGRTADNTLVLRFRVNAVPARVLVRLQPPSAQPVYAEAEVIEDGSVEFVLPFDNNASTEATIMVQMKAGDRTAAQDFKLRRK